MISKLASKGRALATITAGLLWLLTPAALLAQFNDPNADRDALPRVPPGFSATLFAREPLGWQPCSMAFDARGRLFVGMGPQYRNSRPDTPGDSVVTVLDTDGVADQTKVFATGFNAVQGLAWRGEDLWSPTRRISLWFATWTEVGKHDAGQMIAREAKDIRVRSVL